MVLASINNMPGMTAPTSTGSGAGQSARAGGLPIPAYLQSAHDVPSVSSTNDNDATPAPSEAELVLLCLDYLRDLRRSYAHTAGSGDPQEVDLLREAEQLDGDWISLAVYALSRSFVGPDNGDLRSAFAAGNSDDAPTAGNDAYFDPQKAQATTAFAAYTTTLAGSSIAIPSSIDDINREILLPQSSSDTPAGDSYPHDDSHPSNLHRFYRLNGLGGTATAANTSKNANNGGGGKGLPGSVACLDVDDAARPPLTLGELTAAGLSGLGGRSRLAAERDMVRSSLFQQFLTAVGDKGFFDGTTGTTDDTNDNKYEERYRKVVAKFRTKLAAKAGSAGTVSPAAVGAAEQQRRRRQKRVAAAAGAAAAGGEVGPAAAAAKCADASPPPPPAAATAAVDAGAGGAVAGSVATDTSFNQTDLDEAEKMKSDGNAHMQKKEYEEAAESYTTALKLCPNGPQSHVYFSNRSASYLSMKRFEEAIRDSERSLALKPDYAKAHARLGLAQFLLGRYAEAVEAYEAALQLDPDNKASRSYLEKARKKLAAEDAKENNRDSKDMDKGVALSKPPKPTTGGGSPTKTREQIRIDEKEANKFKSTGNAKMAARDHDGAIAAYTSAIELCPDGPSSHVYYSNRAAALCYLERYEQAEEDSETSIRLRPDYGKGWARLGLSRFFLHDYEGAVLAYREALKYEPDNPASRSYHQKAMRKLEEEAEDALSSSQRNGALHTLSEESI